MPAAQRRLALPLIGRLLSRPQQFEFFQAVRLLEAWTSSEDSPSRAGPISFHNRVSMSFPSSDIETIEVRSRGATTHLGRKLDPSAVQIRVTPSFMGLLGSSGALPYAFTESLAAAPTDEKQSLREFFDILSQRSYTLFREAWAKARITYSFDRVGRNALLPTQLCIAGSDPARRGEGVVPSEVRAFYGALLRTRCMSSKVLGQVLSDYFEVPVHVQPCRGEWSQLTDGEAVQLGHVGCRLGADSVIGTRTFQRDRRIRLRIGPLDRTRYGRFLPGSTSTGGLGAMLACFPVVQFQFEVNLVLQASAVQPAVLGSREDDPEAELNHGLGLTSFLGGTEERDRDELVFDLPALTRGGTSGA